MPWGIKINPTRWWSHYQIKSQLNSVDMRGGIEGRLFPTLRRDVTDQYRGRKEAISLTCPQLRVNGLIPPIEITAPDCTHQMLSCITLERQQLDVYPIPLTPPSSTAFVSCAALYYPWWKYNLPLICVPKPYKSKSSKVATFLHRYYVANPHLPFNQERLITRVLDWHSFVASHLRDGLMEKSKRGMTERKRERARKKGKRGDNIVKRPLMTAEQCGRGSI